MYIVCVVHMHTQAAWGVLPGISTSITIFSSISNGLHRNHKGQLTSLPVAQGLVNNGTPKEEMPSTKGKGACLNNGRVRLTGDML